jgi:hypothetical protein
MSFMRIVTLIYYVLALAGFLWIIYNLTRF